ncbi:MAG TPA: hypothetical protein DEA96_10435 [Leptospiraceae bacterium]|nr:hypothetical protein [Spirochaetaceae bacterium]HBS05374.1 hypothetical protein [Leptospiraceae bacterium]|tara:strand:+ start:1140 stop:2039 length:900 start_codon:yes stop_codon:yes gene_type:complete
MGMMGASLAAGLRNQSSPPSITGVVRSDRSKQWIVDHNLADESIASSALDVSGLDLTKYDLIVLGMPIAANGDLLEKLAPMYPTDFQRSKSGSLPLITDMSSTRTFLEEVATRHPHLPFVGSHPMCGSEDAGPAAFRDNLFKDRLVILIRSTMRNLPGEAFEHLHQFWSSLGSRVSELNERDHDLVLAYLSHAPHLVSSLLATVTANRQEVRRINSQSPIPITGGGLRDMLRIAGSNPEMWKDILHTNRKYILESLRDFRTGLDELIDTVESDSMEWWSDWQTRSRGFRNEICGYEKDR